MVPAPAANAAPAYCRSAARLEQREFRMLVEAEVVTLLGTLFSECTPKCLLFEIDIRAITVGINKWVCVAAQSLVFCRHSVIVAMCTQKDIAGQRFQNCESFGKVICNSWIVRVVCQPIARINIGTADDYDVIGFAGVGDAPRPGRAASGMTRRAAGNERHTTQLHLVAVIQHAIDWAWFPAAVLVQVLALAAGSNDFFVATHDIDFGTCLLLDQGVAGDVIGVTVARQEYLDVLQLE